MKSTTEPVDIKSMLAKLKPITPSTPQDERADVVTAISTSVGLCLKGAIIPSQISALLTTMHHLSLSQDPSVILACAFAMRNNAAPTSIPTLRSVLESHKSLSSAGYKGGFCDLVGTGGDSHNTFNISTTASIISSSYLMMAKHGNRASTSKSGSADLLQSMGANLSAVTPSTLPEVYKKSNYAFLFAPIFHPGMSHVGPIRKQLPWRTVFNLLGPLANPVDELIEARVIGVARQEIGPLFAEVFRVSQVSKTLVVCGAENLDEISCAGPTNCWMVSSTPGGESSVTEFQVQPSDFGFPTHALSEVAPGGTPEQNSEILKKILGGMMEGDDPVLRFVLINAAAMLAVSGVCDGTTEEANAMGVPGEVVEERGPGGLRLKEGVRRARYAVEHGLASKEWEVFARATNTL